MSQLHRPPAVAGRFYAADAGALRTELREYLEAAKVDADAAPPKLLVVPHAGYVYSAPVAAHAYARLARWRERYRRVVLLGPTHRVAARGLAVPSVAAFDTPLGAVPIDAEAVARIAALPQVLRSDAAHAQEHALEVQLPFLQAVLGRFTLVPLAVGHVDGAAVAEVLERLWGGDETLVVVSTDLSHYLSYGEARVADAQTVQHILQLDPSLDHDQACGATPLNGALRVARRHGLRARLLDLRNSGDTAGDRSRVVGYAALAFAPAAGAAPLGDDEEAAAAEGVAAGPATAAGDALGPALLSRARNAIAAALELPLVGEPEHPALWAPGATFVTLRRRGELRGCIGRLQADRALYEDVRCNARRAAFEDPRFEPLRVTEWAELEVEVSLLDAPQPMAFDDEADALRTLRPGDDGLIFEWRGRSATFLPQVWEQLPEPAEFVAQLKRKAGLAADFWHAEVRLSRYRVRKFAEGGA
jgi:AmmeMemoRadiSam system protein B/AmmeMemoRadiSam system protein A